MYCYRNIALEVLLVVVITSCSDSKLFRLLQTVASQVALWD